MKKLLLITALALAMATPASAGWIDGAVNTLIAGDAPSNDAKMYRIETMGNDVRIYEWIPEDNPNVRCAFAAGSSNSTGLACYEVEEKKKQ